MIIRDQADWWKETDKHWPNLLAIFERVGMKLDVSEDRNGEIMYHPLRDELERLRKDRDPELAGYFSSAWERAPDSRRIHSWPSWSTLCDLCSESDVLLEDGPKGGSRGAGGWGR